MRPSDELTAFLTGPLSDRRGGSARARAFAEEIAESDLVADDESNSRISNGVRSFLLSSPEPLFSYQREICESLQAWRTTSSTPTALVSLPTGGGKTRVGLWFCRSEFQAERARSLLWVAPSGELVNQAVQTIEDLWSRFPGAPDIQIGVNHIPSSQSAVPRAHMHFVTAQLAARRLDDIRRLAPDLLVFDEAHQAVARTFREIIKNVLRTGQSAVVGLTATPGRMQESEGEALSSLFSENLITASELGANPVEHLMSAGIVSRVEITMLPLPPEWEPVRVRSKSGRALSLTELACHPARFWSSLQKVEELAQSETRCLVFCASLAHMYALGGALKASGTECGVLSYQTSASKRRRLLSEFSEGTLPVLLNKTLLAEGFDCPAISDVVLTTPIRSPILWEQIVGRASRGPAVGGTPVGRIWELDDHRAMHRELLSYARFLGALWD